MHTTPPAAHILLVDSDRDSLTMYASMLSFHGFGAHVCGNEDEAVAHALECGPAAVVFGLGAPGSASMEALRALRTHPATSHLPALVTTTSLRAAVRDAAEELGAEALLLKPCTPTQLLAALHEVLNAAAV
jgi:CheY-like chemotaxis protein